MITQSFFQRIGILFFIIFSFVIFTQSAHAKSILECVPFTFSESYAVNNQTLPAQVEVRTFSDGLQYLINTGSKTLTFHDTLNTNSLRETLLLVNGKAVVTYGNTPEKTYVYTDGAAFGAAALHRIIYFNTPRINHNSKIQPKQPEPTSFSILATYEGRQITITGIITYELHEKDCSLIMDVQQRKSFWGTIFQFFASLKFW